MFGQYYECDACHARLYADRPDPGWLGMNRVLSADQADTVRIDEQHACSDACAHRLLMTDQTPVEGIH